MGLFSKKPGGSFFGNLLRTGVNVAQNIGGINLGLGSGANRIEKGQKYSNKQIEGNPGLFITPGETATNQDIDKDGSLSKGYYRSTGSPVYTSGAGTAFNDNPISRAIEKVKTAINSAGQTIDNSQQVSSMMKWAIPAMLVGLVLIVFRKRLKL